MTPKIKRNFTFESKTCARCHRECGPEQFAQTKSWFYQDGHLPICNDCIETFLVSNDFNWVSVDKICQWADIPFIPAEFERLHEVNGTKVFPIYASVFLSEEFDSIGWGDYYEEFKRLKEQGRLEEQLPEIYDEKIRKLQDKWGKNYDIEALNYLEGLYDGLIKTQNVNGALQTDQALKICKISYELDCRIREGADFDKILTAYDKLVKTAEFTPKNVKNASDFESTGELFRWLEKRGWVNKYFDDVTKDVVDETMKNIQNFNQRLYTNETGIGEEITRRIEALKNVNEMESYYGSQDGYDLDNFDNDGYEGLFGDDDFSPDVENLGE